jgi:excisionase family DNA binding protein
MFFALIEEQHEAVTLDTTRASVNTMEVLRKVKGLAGVPEVCHLLGVSRNTIFAWVKAGRLKAYRVGNSLKVDRAGLAAWLEARQL